ncbi:ABC transporter substrate-binding protein [Halosimplex sp. J119]
MVEESGNHTGETRRKVLKYSSGVALSGVLAGCTGGLGTNGTSAAPEETAVESPTPTPAETTAETTDNADATVTGGSGEYSVTMEPAGEVTFDSIPERWIAYCGEFADMGVALGQADGMTGIGGADRYYTDVYDELPGVEVDPEPLESYPEVRTKEEFYELENDVHLYDPQMLINWFDWDQSDLDEIADNVAPFIGNLIFRRSDKWHDYRYYTLYQAFEKVAEVFQERERYEAFKELHDEFIADIQSRLPPTEERPNVFLTYGVSNEPEEFTPYRLIDKGTSKKQWRDLGVGDALSGTDIQNQSSVDNVDLDYEALLELDPDVILIRNHAQKSVAEFRDTVVAFMEDHPIGGELTAVQNGRVYRGGYLHQGPIHNLFLTEQAAKQLFPDEFGDVTSDTELFDRQRVADIITGDF